MGAVTSPTIHAPRRDTHLIPPAECMHIGIRTGIPNRATPAAAGIDDPTETAQTVKAWLRADLGVTDVSGKASDWACQVTATNWTNATAGQRPAITAGGPNSTQILTFLGGAPNYTHLASAGAVFTSTTWTAIMVWDGDADSQYVAMSTDADLKGISPRGSTSFGAVFDGGWVPSTTAYTGAFSVMTVSADLVTGDARYWAGTGGDPATPDSTNALYAGLSWTGASDIGRLTAGNYFIGSWAEFILYDVALDATEPTDLTNLWAYINTRYGL